jgi:hypothetical protein
MGATQQKNDSKSNSINFEFGKKSKEKKIIADQQASTIRESTGQQEPHVVAPQGDKNSRVGESTKNAKPHVSTFCAKEISRGRELTPGQVSVKKSKGSATSATPTPAKVEA